MLKKELLILTGESSGEFYGALLSKEIFKKWPDAEIWGIGGERMAGAGVKLLGRPGHAFGLFEAAGALRNIRKNYRAVVEYLNNRRPQVIVLIDYPDFNIRIGKVAKKLGIKVLYYVSPQVWAWRKKRCFVIKEISDYIALILPFEEPLYKEIGARAEFVGHPALEEIEDIEFLLSKDAPTDGYRRVARELLGIKDDRPVISLLPGSRPLELKRLLPVIRETVQKIEEVLKDHPVFLMPVAPNLSEEDKNCFKGVGHGVRILPSFISFKDNVEKINLTSSIISLMASDIAIAASGTVVFQAALIGVPTVAIYRLSPLTYFIGRLLVDVKYITLPNIILDREVFPELLQRRADKDNIIKYAMRFLESEELRDTVRKELLRMREIFSNKRPSSRVAEIAGELARW